MWLSGDHGRLIKWHPLVNFKFERIRAMEFKLISIASIIAFYGCYFVKMFHQKKQGIQTDQIFILCGKLLNTLIQSLKLVLSSDNS